MQEEFREEYRKANDSVHVPEELMERTVKAVRTEERRQKTTYLKEALKGEWESAGRI